MNFWLIENIAFFRVFFTACRNFDIFDTCFMYIYNAKKLEQNGNEIILLLIVYETKVSFINLSCNIAALVLVGQFTENREGVLMDNKIIFRLNNDISIS